MEYDNIVREAVNEQSGTIIVAKDGKYYQIDTDGNPLSKQYDYLRPATAEGYAIIRNEIGLAIINPNEQIIAQTHYQEHYRSNCYPDWLFYWCTPDSIAFYHRDSNHRLCFTSNRRAQILPCDAQQPP